MMVHFWSSQAGCGLPRFGLLRCASLRRGSGPVHLCVLFLAWSFPVWLVSAWFFLSMIVLCMVFHGEVISASHQLQRICPPFFWICLCSEHLSAVRLSPDQPSSVCFAHRDRPQFLLSIDLLGEVLSCFGMVVLATV